MRYWLAVIMVMMAVNCWGEFDKGTQKVEKVTNVNGDPVIFVWTQYLKDTKPIVVSNYPQTADAKRPIACPTEYWSDAGCTAVLVIYQPDTFAAMTADEMKTVIKKDVQSRLNTLVRREYNRKVADSVITALGDKPLDGVAVKTTTVQDLPSIAVKTDIALKDDGTTVSK